MPRFWGMRGVTQDTSMALVEDLGNGEHASRCSSAWTLRYASMRIWSKETDSLSRLGIGIVGFIYFLPKFFFFFNLAGVHAYTHICRIGFNLGFRWAWYGTLPAYHTATVPIPTGYDMLIWSLPYWPDLYTLMFSYSLKTLDSTSRIANLQVWIPHEVLNDPLIKLSWTAWAAWVCCLG